MSGGQNEESGGQEEKKEVDMPASSRQTEKQPVSREPAEPPPYWWRRGEVNQGSMALSLLVEEPEVLDPSDLIEGEGEQDETWPNRKLPLSADLP